MITWFFKQLWYKMVLTALRLYHYALSWPRRVCRFGRHIAHGFEYLRPGERRYWFECPLELKYWQKVLLWSGEWLMYISDVLGVGELYGILMDWVKFNSRPLRGRELDLARPIYGDSIPYSCVSVDDWGILGFKVFPSAQAYVSFHTINTRGPMTNGVFIHELVHVWQYQRLGSVYMSRALLAQHSTMQYNYGGAAALKQAIARRHGFDHFNFEQQGDIIQDYYRIKSGYPPIWGAGGREDLPYYQYFVDELSGNGRQRKG